MRAINFTFTTSKTRTFCWVKIKSSIWTTKYWCGFTFERFASASVFGRTYWLGPSGDIGLLEQDAPACIGSRQNISVENSKWTREVPWGAVYNQLWLRRKELSKLPLFHRTRHQLLDRFALNINSGSLLRTCFLFYSTFKYKQMFPANMTIRCRVLIAMTQ